MLVNETYAARIKRGASREEDRQYLSANLQTANWLTKSLEQRARTLLNVASEIVRRQDSFLVEGVVGLRPLNLKAVADAIGVHEFTVSRATSNKFIQTPRGLFEMKYFFTTSIASVSNGAAQAHSAESRPLQDQTDDRRRGPKRRAVRRRHRRRGCAARTSSSRAARSPNIETACVSPRRSTAVGEKLTPMRAQAQPSGPS